MTSEIRGDIETIFHCPQATCPHHECATLSNGNSRSRKRINHISHTAENMKLCNKGRGDDTEVDFSIWIQAEVSQLHVVRDH